MGSCNGCSTSSIIDYDDTAVLDLHSSLKELMEQNRLNLEAPWDQVKEKIKERYIDISDEDLRFEPGQEQQLIERLQKKMNKSSEEVKAYIESISSNSGMAG